MLGRFAYFLLPLDFNQTIIERRSPADVGNRLRGDLVRVAAVCAELLPPHRERHDHALAGLVADARSCGERTAVVEDAHRVALSDAPRAGVGRLDVEARLPGL